MDITTQYGTLHNCYNVDYHNNGQLAACICREKSPIYMDKFSILPYFSENSRRKASPSIKFYDNGNLKAVYLEKRTTISTPWGKISTEMLTFYPNGNICRVFPLNGQISAYWSEKNEAALIDKSSFSFACGNFSARPMCFHFYETGELKSLTLQPAEQIELATSVGKIKIKCGLSFYKNGQLASIEPALPQKINTPIGSIKTFNPNSVDVSADKNSLCFSETGLLSSCKTTTSIIAVKDNKETVITPDTKRHPLSDTAVLTIPLTIKFAKEHITIIKNEQKIFQLNSNNYRFIIK